MIRQRRQTERQFASGTGFSTCRSFPLSRRGIETLEALIAFPVLIVATVGALEFAIIMATQQTVTSAAIAGVNVAANGGNITAVTTKVNEFLAVHGIQVVSAGTAVVQLDDASTDTSTTSPSPNDTGITFTPFGPATNTLDNNQVRVTVCVKFTNGSGKPVPDWLSSVGFALGNRYFQASSLAELE